MYSLKLDDNGKMQEEEHKFAFHRSQVTCIEFFHNNTQMASGSADTYIIVYDLIADTAQFKFLGHNEQITSLATLDYLNPTKGNE